MENPIKMDDLGVALFLETPNCRACFMFVVDFYGSLRSKMVKIDGLPIPKGRWM